MYKLKKALFCKRVLDEFEYFIEQNPKYSDYYHYIINLKTYFEHQIDDIDLKEMKNNRIVFLDIKNIYDTKYALSFFKQGVLTFVNFHFLFDYDKSLWFKIVENEILYKGTIAYIEEGVYALVPHNVKFIEHKQKIKK